MNYGPKIVKDGLLFTLDGGDVNSFVIGNTNWKDASGNYSTTSTNNPRFKSISANKAGIPFNGSNQYVTLLNSTGLNFANTTATVSLWFKTGSTFPSGAYFIAKNLDATGGWAFTLGSNGIPYFETKNNASGAASMYRFANVACNDDVWHNLVAVFTTSTTVVANNTISIYLDGVLANGALTQSLVYSGSAGNIEVGRRPSGGYYGGYISNVLLYNRGLTSAEILQNYNALYGRLKVNSTDLISNGLVLYLDAGDTNSYSGSGTAWTDLIGSSVTSTLINSPTFNSGSQANFAFNGTNNYVDLSDFSLGTAFTFCFWIKTSSSTFGQLMARGSSADTFGVYMAINISAGLLCAGGNAGGGWTSGNISNTVINNNAWHYVCGVFDQTAGNCTGYVDAVAGLTATIAFTSDGYSPRNVKIARNHIGASQFFTGNIALCHIYNRKLSSTEITQNFNLTKSRFGL